MEIVTFTTLFPSDAQQNHGIFVENRLRHLVETGQVGSRVVAPVPYFPFRSRKFGARSAFARVPLAEHRSGLDVLHPRYLVIPRIGMTIAPLLLFCGSLRSLLKLARTRSFDLLDAHYLYPDGVAAVLLGAVLRKPVVITARGTDVNFIPKFLLPRMMIRAAARKAAGVIVVSDALKRALVGLGVAEKSIVVLRNGIDLNAFRPGGREAARHALGLKGPVLLSVGQLIERKGHHLVIAAMPRLADCTLLIAGDGPDRSTLEALATKLGVAGRVHFMGEVPHRDLPNLYSAADALVLASSREGWPNVLLEAMACGTPVVATPVWGTPEVVSTPAAGLLTKDRSASAIADTVEALLRQPPDRAHTRSYAENFSWDATTQGQLQLFREILERWTSAGA